MLRFRKKKEIQAIKAKDNESIIKVEKGKEEIGRKLLEANNAEVKVIEHFIKKGDMTPMQLQEELLPIEQERIQTAIEFSGIKDMNVVKKQK